MKISNEAKIGMMVTMVMIFLIGLTIKSGNFQLVKKGYFINIHFNSIDGIKMNAPVMVNGLEVGRVKDITMFEDGNAIRMEVVIWIYLERRGLNRFWVRWCSMLLVV